MQIDDHALSPFALDVYRASGRPPDAKVEGHLDECAACRKYLEALDGFASTAPPSDAEARPRFRTRGPGRRPFAWLAAAAIGFVLFGVARRGTRLEPYIAAKGTPAVQVLVHRGEQTIIWDGRSPVRPGDALALRVVCAGLRRVTVATRMPDVTWQVLSSAPCPGQRDVLPFTLNVDGRAGEEGLAVVLSGTDLGEDALRTELARTRRDADVWVVRFILPKEAER